MIVLRKDVISTDMISATSISTAQLADINSDPLRCTPSIADNLLLRDPAKVLDPGCHGGEGFATLIDILSERLLMSIVTFNMLCRVLLAAAFLIALVEGENFVCSSREFAKKHSLYG